MVDERAPILRAVVRMHGHAGLFVHEQDVFVLIDDVELRRRHRQIGVGLGGLVEKLVVDIELQHIALLQARVALRAGVVALDTLEADILLRQRGGQQRNGLCQKAVEPLPGVIAADGQFFHGSVVSFAEIGQQRTMKRKHSARDFLSSRDSESAGVLCVLQTFRTDGSAKKIRRRPKRQWGAAAFTMPQIVRIVKVFYEKIEKGFDKITKNRYNISCTTMEQGIIMLLGLSKIMQKPDSVLPFHTALDLHDLQFGGSFPVQEPVSAEGTVRNTAGVLVLEAVIATNLHAVCDRCAAPFERRVSWPVHAVLTRSLEREDEADEWTFLLQEGDKADLDEILTTAFVLNMDSKLLCRPDCKGICPRCGKNLNEGACSCRPEIDPRLAVLGQLLKDK